jgi:uncharacterized protein YprB with RNaseH-like and TPR domain
MALDYLRQYAPQRATSAEPLPLEEDVTDRVPIEDIFDGPMLADPAAALVTTSDWAGDHTHGLHQLRTLRDIGGEQLALISLDPELAYTDLAHAVFLDTETTGLSTGVGTYVFLVGAGYFEGERFHVTQFFLRSPGEELPFLNALDSFLRRFSMIVSFNGKAFDWPLLEGRFVRQREFRRAPLDDPPHLDLLHPARRIWKRRLASCALASLEQEILKVRRTGQDVPGWLIPSLYFRYLRTGDGSVLRGVLYHNLHDILSLATLVIHMSSVVTDPLAGLVSDGLDFLSIGRLHERQGNVMAAAACYDEALRHALSAEHRRECLAHLSGCHKRERRWEAALAVWERLIDEGGLSAVHGLVERAKYHEHVEREYMDALEDVQHALQLADLDESLEVDRKSLEHRLARLLNRVFRNRSWVGDSV